MDRRANGSFGFCILMLAEPAPWLLGVPVAEANGEGPVTVSGVGTAVWTVILDRSDRRNAVDEAMQAAILSAVRAATIDPNVRSILLTGAGSSFSAGGDFGLIRRMQDDGEVRRRVLDQSRSLFGSLRDLHVPIVAAINGPAIGAGCTLALLCDIVIMAEEASLGDPRVAFGLAPGDGAAVLWPLLGGLPAARSYLLTGDQVSAEEAYRIGLVSQVVSAADLQETAMAVASRLASLPPAAVQATKRVLNQYLVAAETPVFELALAAERTSFDNAEHRDAIRRVSAPAGDTRRDNGKDREPQ
jgi:enoyl-CoA hydratase